jgi:uncharacterized protein CbrC (UPF0167 family)
VAKIFNFNQFLAEQSSMGAGVVFAGTCSMTAVYEVSTTGARRTGLDARPGRFSANGLGVNFQDAAPWLLETDTTAAKSAKGREISRAKMPEISEEVSRSLKAKSGKYGTIEDFLRANPDSVVTVKVVGGYNYKQVHFKGFTRGQFNPGDVVMEQVDSLDEGYTSVFIQGISAPGNEELVMSLAPELKANGRFKEFFDEVFNDRGKMTFVRDEVRSMALAGKLRSEIEELIETAAGYDGWVYEKFLREVEKSNEALTDLVGFIEDREPITEIEARWKEGLKEEYSSKRDPVA